MNIKELAHEVQPEIVEFRRDLHIHPELSLQEFRTSKRIAEELDKLGVSYRMLEPTGVVAEIKGGKGPGKTVALRGDIDALDQTERTGLPYASQTPGVMHACGHDTHASMLLGAVKVVNRIKDEFAGTVRFIFQPAEEVGKGAGLAIAQGALEGVDAIFGMHIGSQKPVGQLSSVPGPSNASTDWFKVKIIGKATHGAYPHGGIDATVAAASVVMNLQTIVSREFDPTDSIVVTVGSFHSGSRFNIISGEAYLEGTIRTYSREVHDAMPEVFDRVVTTTAAALRCKAEIEFLRVTDVLVNDADMYELGMAAANKVSDKVITGKATMGGEDFAEYTRCCPACFFNLGAGGESPAHSDYFAIEEDAFETGVAFYAQVAMDFLAK